MPGIYIHVPFCASKCPYCDFYSVADRGRIDNYISAVIDELSTLRRVGPLAGDLKHRAIATVYFGGGTPSFLGAENLAALLRAVKKNFNVAPGAEITAECNPSSSLAPGFFETLAAAGFNRVSLGMQSAVDAERRKLGRRATVADVETAVKACQSAGITDISLDIMLGVPEQTERSLLSSLDFALSLGVTHLSAYLLSIEESDIIIINASHMDVKVFTGIFCRYIDNTAKPEESINSENVLWFTCYSTLIVNFAPCGVVEG